MQFLSFTYSLGGIVGPLLVQPFLAPEGNTSIAAPPTAAPQYQLPLQASHTANGSDHHLSPSTNHSPIAAFSSVTNRAQVTSTTPFSPLVLPQLSHVGNGSAFPVRGLTSPCVVSNLSCGSDSSQQPEEVFLDGYSSRIHLPYIIAGIMSIVAALPFCLVYLRSRCKAAAAKKNLAARKVPFDEEEDQKHRQKLPLKVYVMLMGLLSAFYFFYTSVDDPFSMYLSIFVVSEIETMFTLPRFFLFFFFFRGGGVFCLVLFCFCCLFFFALLSFLCEYCCCIIIDNNYPLSSQPPSSSLVIALITIK